MDTTLIPEIRFTHYGATFRANAIPMLQTILEAWKHAQYPRIETYRDMTHPTYCAQQTLFTESKRVKNPGQFARVYDIDNSCSAIALALHWAEQRIANWEYTPADYLRAFDGDTAKAERAYLQAIF